MARLSDYNRRQAGRSNVRHCQKCRAPIVWAKTVNGKWMPMDAVPVDDGDWRFVNGAATKIVPGTVLGDDELRFTPHWATCIHADDFRGARDVAP